ncbi:hypothetical protein EZY14_007145 [Kordia sp. TARA_039_SRF]|nr:hypothetical protein EZY14_007145 [Kordia sp. TARA_039_SRF]
MLKDILKLDGVKELDKKEQHAVAGGRLASDCRLTGSLTYEGSYGTYTTASYRCGGDTFGDGYTVNVFYVNGVYESHTTLYEV